MRQNDGLTDCQSETVARYTWAVRMVAADEWLEYLLMARRGNAWTAIRYDQFQFAVTSDAS